MSGFVYKWSNKVNNKWYIGSHKGSLDDGYIGSGYQFNLALKKYGIESFTREILYEGDDYREVETQILTKLNAKDDKMSYNVVNSGGSEETRFKKGKEAHNKGLTLEERYGVERAAEIRKNISESAKKRKRTAPVTEETREKLRQKSTGRKFPNTKKWDESRREKTLSTMQKRKDAGLLVHSEATKAKMKESSKKRWQTPLVCPHCSKEGNGPWMQRYHFKGCKDNPDNKS